MEINKPIEIREYYKIYICINICSCGAEEVVSEKELLLSLLPIINDCYQQNLLSHLITKKEFFFLRIFIKK